MRHSSLSVSNNAPGKISFRASPLPSRRFSRLALRALNCRAWRTRANVADLQLALITASSLGEVESVEMLLSDGAKPSKGDYDKRTALHLAASEGHAPVVQRLLAAGAPPNSEDRWGGTPLDDAKEKKHSEVIELLRKIALTGFVLLIPNQTIMQRTLVNAGCAA